MDFGSEAASRRKVKSISTDDPILACFLSERGLPYVLQLLRGCFPTDAIPAVIGGLSPAVGCISTFSPHLRRPTLLARLLGFLHQLETCKSTGRVGLLAEDMLSAWVEGLDIADGPLSSFGSIILLSDDPSLPCEKRRESNDQMSEEEEEINKMQTMSPSFIESISPIEIVRVIKDLRRATALRTRQRAQNVRQRQLRSLNMKVNEKGQRCALFGEFSVASSSAVFSASPPSRFTDPTLTSYSDLHHVLVDQFLISD
ncbi:unnamed protein product [Protopolystoma xenopodis]|uniref:Uncharacterized protein n=1 Tax=Protopolystoma xenopodis TaxID=117903 RepID=A0A3S5AX98_9PLAT|nr:unnamed protein product [Protopolystoma xenopodis]